MTQKVNDPYTVVMHQQKLPMGLLNDPFKNARMNLLSTESFASTFGSKSTRKRARLEAFTDIDSLSQYANTVESKYDQAKDSNKDEYDDTWKETGKEKVFEKGQSKRIWNELYKVVDSADVVVQVLDVRDPMGTRCKRIEDELKKTDRRHKHMVLILNKCDLVPTWVTRRWTKVLSKEYPTLAFHASITNPFGKGSLIQLLRQFGRLHGDKKQISVGFVGYPNVGKSSVINTMRGETVCEAAPIPGQTKHWKYITLFKRIYLIDCPGVVYPFGNTNESLLLKGVVKMEKIDEPAAYIGAVLDRVRKAYLSKHYGIEKWEDAADFLDQVCRKTGKLVKGGEPDLNNGARIILNDWVRGRLPYFVCPPFEDDERRMALMNDAEIGAQLKVRQKQDKQQNKQQQVISSQLDVEEQEFDTLNVRNDFDDEDANEATYLRLHANENASSNLLPAATSDDALFALQPIDDTRVVETDASEDERDEEGVNKVDDVADHVENDEDDDSTDTINKRRKTEAVNFKTCKVGKHSKRNQLKQKRKLSQK
jgi:nuclear GTP-binding protein